MRSKLRGSRTASLAVKLAPAIVGGPVRQLTPTDSLPPRDDAAVSPYEREIDRLDAAVHVRI
jgi:hypothetical protein